MRICAILLSVVAGVFLGGPSARAAVNSEGGAAQTNPMQLDGAKATPFDFAASPLGETSKVRLIPTESSTPAAKIDPAERSLQNETGPVVIPLPPAVWTGAAGLLVLIGWLSVRGRRQSC